MAHFAFFGAVCSHLERRENTHDSIGINTAKRFGVPFAVELFIGNFKFNFALRTAFCARGIGHAVIAFGSGITRPRARSEERND